MWVQSTLEDKETTERLRKMKLLILGAGGYGRICGDLTVSQGWEIAFLDVNSTDSLVGLADNE